MRQVFFVCVCDFFPHMTYFILLILSAWFIYFYVIFFLSVWIIYFHMITCELLVNIPVWDCICDFCTGLCWTLDNNSYLWFCLQLQIPHGDLCVYFVVERMGCSSQSFPQCQCRLLINTDRFISAPVGTLTEQQYSHFYSQLCSHENSLVPFKTQAHFLTVISTHGIQSTLSGLLEKFCVWCVTSLFEHAWLITFSLSNQVLSGHDAERQMNLSGSKTAESLYCIET